MAYPPSSPADNKVDATPTPTDHPAHHNALADAIISIVAELGSAPHGVAADLTARLTALDSSLAGKQPLDSDLTAIAALTTTTFGRALLALADAAAGRTAFGLGTAATSATGDFDAAGAAAAAQAASQPLDSDLTAIAALTTTSYGRAFLALADAAAGRTALGLGTASTSASTDFQPVDSDLTAIAALTTTSFGRAFLALADAAAARVAIGVDFASPTVALGSSASAGSAGSVIHSDATIAAFDATAPSTQAFGDSAVVGTAAYAARRDHKHAMPANPAPSFATPAVALGTAAAAGAASTVIRSDSTIIAFDTTVPVTQAYSDAAATGSAAIAARRDHVHGMPTAFGLSIFGDGSDGTQTFDGSTTILSLAPSSSVYTLARDLFLAAGTINNGVTIITNGYRIFCAGTLTNNGTIQWNGNAASGSAAGAEVSNSLGSMHRGSSTTAPGTAGGAGGTGAGSAGSNNANGSTMGARGGSGGLGPSGAGGAAGTVITPGGANLLPRQGVSGVLFQFVIPGAAGAIGILSAIQGGSGGGGGGGDSTHAGGGGGGGGGLVAVYSKTVAGTGAIQARGGNGANGSSGNAGGGGGGGGGFVLVISSSASAGAISGQTIDSNGGTKGTKVGTGVDGSNGSNGSTVVLAA